MMGTRRDEDDPMTSYTPVSCSLTLDNWPRLRLTPVFAARIAATIDHPPEIQL